MTNYLLVLEGFGRLQGFALKVAKTPVLPEV